LVKPNETHFCNQSDNTSPLIVLHTFMRRLRRMSRWFA